MHQPERDYSWLRNQCVIFGRILMDMLLGKRPAVDVQRCSASRFDRAMFPTTTKPNDVEPIGAKRACDVWEYIVVMISRDRDRGNPMVGEPSQTAFERSDRFEVLVCTIDNVATQRNDVGLVRDCAIDNIVPSVGARERGLLTTATYSRWSPANVQVASAQDLHAQTIYGIDPTMPSLLLSAV
jgi:hypothetical protein